jgi:hypothetical protein
VAHLHQSPCPMLGTAVCLHSNKTKPAIRKVLEERGAVLSPVPLLYSTCGSLNDTPAHLMRAELCRTATRTATRGAERGCVASRRTISPQFTAYGGWRTAEYPGDGPYSNPANAGLQWSGTLRVEAIRTEFSRASQHFIRNGFCISVVRLPKLFLGQNTDMYGPCQVPKAVLRSTLNLRRS